MDIEFKGEITAVSAAVTSKTGEDGVKTKEGFTKVSVQSASIEYDAINTLNPYIGATLLNIQPMPFKSVSFGEQSISNLKLSLFHNDEDCLPECVNDEALGQCGIEITNITVKNVDNIPVYKFDLKVLVGDVKLLHKVIKRTLNFKLWK